MKRKASDARNRQAKRPRTEPAEEGTGFVPRARTVARTKRRAPVPTEAERRRENRRDSVGFIDDVYRRYYRGRVRLERGDLNNSLYRFSGYGDPGYIARPLDEGAFLEFVRGVSHLCKVFCQGGGTLQDGLKKADYIFFDSNVVQKTSSGGAYDGRIHERRLIVNLTSQQAALDLAKGLVRLFDLTDDRRIAPYFRQFKVKLSTKTDQGDPVKHDKLVLYYGTDERERGDRVGDELVTFIDDRVPDRDRNHRFGAFYSKVVKGVAWADEPDHIDVPKPRSFTDSRTAALEKVIKDHDYVRGPDAFFQLVLAEFRRSNIDWPDAHRNREDPEPPS
ncbi:MAG: hypothetical protein HOY71_40310 [Nonomuraea sp.]|nr:hypothetical protein [Nonomuraea sp.]